VRAQMWAVRRLFAVQKFSPRIVPLLALSGCAGVAPGFKIDSTPVLTPEAAGRIATQRWDAAIGEHTSVVDSVEPQGQYWLVTGSVNDTMQRCEARLDDQKSLRKQNDLPEPEIQDVCISTDGSTRALVRRRDGVVSKCLAGLKRC
jgi:hypothetical protein